MPTTYDRIAPRYETAIGPLERWFLKGLRREAIAALPKAGRILELGAGTGLNFVHYESGWQGVATEPSVEMLRIARRKNRPGSLSLIQSSAEYLPFGNATFDGAFATLVMCSVKSPDQVFAELRRVVRPGGTISLLDHVRPSGLLGPFFDLLNLVTEPLFDDHFNRRPAEIARRAGLQVTNVRKVGLGIFNLTTCLV